METIRLRRGLDIPLKGEANPTICKGMLSKVIAVKPSDFKNVIPKLLVQEGEAVKAGQVLFTDKNRPYINITSPVSGVIKAIVRGEKRKLLAVEITPGEKQESVLFQRINIEKCEKAEIVDLLLKSGLWCSVIQRPYGIIANPEDTPKAIVISGFNSAPLAADINFTLMEEVDNLQVALKALSKLTSGRVYVNIDGLEYASSPFKTMKGVVITQFLGKHPAGNVGIQISHICPIGKGEIVWTLQPQALAAIGKLLSRGIFDLSRLVAVAGPRVKNPAYVRCLPGACLKDIEQPFDLERDEQIYSQNCGIRHISGNVLSGENVGENGYLGYYDDTVTLISEGNYREIFGWAKLFRPRKFSFSSTYFSWLCRHRKYEADSNLNGGVRPFVVNSLYEKMLPMDIYPVYLLKAILAGDIEKMEQLGIYEVIGEDLALCEYVCPSKINICEIVEQGINLMLKEMA